MKTITLRTQQEKSHFLSTHATVYQVAEKFDVHISTAYKYMREMDPILVRDVTDKEEMGYIAVRRSAMKSFIQPRRGNPNFRRSSYQKDLRSRRW